MLVTEPDRKGGAAVVDPITLGVLVSAFIAGMGEGVGEHSADAGMSVLRRLIKKLKDRFQSKGDESGEHALARVEDPPAGEAHIKALAERIDALVAEDPSFGTELGELLEEAERAGIQVQQVAQTAIGSGNVQIQGVSSSTINVNTEPGNPT